jgi:hypothetical protein
VFARNGQGHECSPAISLDEYFSTGPERERPIFDAVLGHLDGVGPVHVEPVSVGIFLKRAQCFAQLRPMQRWEALWLRLPRKVTDRRITRTLSESGASNWYVVRAYGPDDVDDVVRDWLTEAYLASPE